MSVEPRGDRSRYAWRPGRGFAGGAVTGVWFTLAMPALTVLVDATASGWRLGLLPVAAGELVGTLVVAVPVFTLAGGALRPAPRIVAVGAYAAAGVLARVLLGPLVESAVGSQATTSASRVALLAAVSLVAGVLAATVSTRDRLPRTTGLLRFRAGGPPTGGAVPGPSAAPAPASRYLAGGS